VETKAEPELLDSGMITKEVVNSVEASGSKEDLRRHENFKE
jgi:hypothetical protein